VRLPSAINICFRPRSPRSTQLIMKSSSQVRFTLANLIDQISYPTQSRLLPIKWTRVYSQNNSSDARLVVQLCRGVNHPLLPQPYCVLSHLWQNACLLDRPTPSPGLPSPRYLSYWMNATRRRDISGTPIVWVSAIVLARCIAVVNAEKWRGCRQFYPFFLLRRTPRFVLQPRVTFTPTLE
jgi:hypothetical protein